MIWLLLLPINFTAAMPPIKKMPNMSYEETAQIKLKNLSITRSRRKPKRSDQNKEGRGNRALLLQRIAATKRRNPSDPLNDLPVTPRQALEVAFVRQFVLLLQRQPICNPE